MEISVCSDGFVSLADYIPNAVMDIRYYTPYNFVGERIDGYEEPAALATVEMAEALRIVDEEARRGGLCLKIYDTYRPQMAVDHFVRWAEDLSDTRMKDVFYPDVDKSRLFEEGYIAAHSGHSRGSTVDLTLCDIRIGKDLDMGGTFDFFGERSHSDYMQLTSEQLQNRELLKSLMCSHGFRGIQEEWWHFTLCREPYPDTYFNFPVRANVIQHTRG